jgi:hypothetical protein
VSEVMNTCVVGHAVDLTFFATRCEQFVVIAKFTSGRYVGVFA